MALRSYLDYNATSPLKDAVQQAMQALPNVPYNASSLHSYGREARRLMEAARLQIKGALGLAGHDDSYQCVFTASGTEANNVALRGVVSDTLLVSAIEHASVLKIAHPQKKVIAVGSDGIVDLAALEQLLEHAAGTIMVSVMLANNETGIIQPIAEIARLVHRYQALLHCDAVQGLGKIVVDCAALEADLLTVSAHKCGGPLGAAALLYRKSLPLSGLLEGGGQERGVRSGTENIPAIVGFGVAAAMAALDVASDASRIAALRDRLEAALEDAVMIGKDQPRLPGTSYLVMPGVSSEVQLIGFDLSGIAVSSGSACSSGKVSVSHVLLAMGIAEHSASCGIRVSMGAETTEQDIKRFCAAWKEIYARHNSMAA